MGLRDQIFPPGPPVDGNIIRTEWVGTWESQLLGLGRLTKFLTDRLLSESFGIDDIALYVMFLQRHRVEVGLKLVLERAQGTIPGTHKLQPLMGSAKGAVKSAGLVAPWDRFEGAQAEYIGLVDEIDEGAATFRYPVDRDQHPWPRENYVDLRAFERAGAAFQADALLLVEALSQLEPLPILSADADGTARELRELASACRQMAAVSEHLISGVQAHSQRLTWRAPGSSAAEIATRASDAVIETSREVADRADRVLALIEGSFDVKLEPEAPADPLPAVPELSFSLMPGETAAQLQELMRLVAQTTAAWLRRLMAAMDAVATRSATWSTPYARQLHAEVARLRSRTGRLS